MDIYSYDDFRDCIRSEVKRNQDTRGYQTRLAEAAGCQRSYLSQVLHSHVVITPDQALGMAEFWGLKDEEADYFLWLVGIARASSKNLQAHLKRKIEAARERHRDLTHRVGSKTDRPAPEIQARYYSAWFWSAIHMATCLNAFGTSDAIGKRLGLEPALVTQILGELQAAGLVTQKGGKWKIGVRHLHLGKDSPFMVTHHTHWRMRAISKIQRSDFSDLHYSGILSIGLKDFREVQEMLLQFISKVRRQVEVSPDEELVVFNCDFFRM